MLPFSGWPRGPNDSMIGDSLAICHWAHGVLGVICNQLAKIALSEALKLQWQLGGVIPEGV